MIVKTILLLFFYSWCVAQEKTTDYYPNGKVRSQGTVRNSLKEGKWEYYYPTGHRQAIENFDAGILNGRV